MNEVFFLFAGQAEERRHGLSFRGPKPWLLEPDTGPEEGAREPLHLSEERREISVVGIDIVERHEHRPERALATLGNDNPGDVRQVRGNRRDSRKLKSA